MGRVSVLRKRIERGLVRSLWRVGLASLLAASSGAFAAFPDAFNSPPAGWTGPVFKLSQSYPATRPRLEPASRARWRNLDFRNAAQAPQYMRAVLDYCLEGNRDRDFQDIGNNPIRKWYHAPWLHAGAAGRDFIHGLTQERPSRPGELGPQHTTQFDNWGIGIFNARGGYTIGQVWKNEQRPDPRKANFPSHTVSCKFLFTRATVAQAPYLEGSLEWQADVNRSAGTGARPVLRLLQIDVAVKDPRANSTTGWVFGTYQFHKDFSPSTNWWDDLMPVGMLWGNDVERIVANQPSREQWVNPARLAPVLHMGFRDLVNGPVDNPRSSCIGCHARAQINRINDPTPGLPAIPPENNPSETAIRAYFRNLRAATALSADYASVDYSLQLQLGIRRAIETAGSGVTLPPDFGNANRIVRAAARRAPATVIVPVGREE